MDSIVLVKVVPDADGLAADPATGTARRDGVPMFLNPFDQRAVRVALDLRRSGEHVTVVSMGPPSAGPALHETRGLGADRAILVSDRALAGSDTLVTARVLARALHRLSGDLVLAGRWSTDSETGQVPPQLAQLLDRPFVPAARRIVRNDRGTLDVDRDTETGWESVRVALPAVVSVGEKIAKIRKLLPEEVRDSQALSVETWTLADLGIEASSVGLAASPTFVARLVEETPARASTRFDQGTVAERVAGAVALLQQRAQVRPSISAPPPPMSAAAAPPGRFLVLASDAFGRRSPGALDLIAGLRADRIARSIEAVTIGEEPSETGRREWAGAGAVRGWHSSRAAGPIASDDAASALGSAADAGELPIGVAVLSDLFGRSVAGGLSAARGWGLTGDATGIALDGQGRPVYRKPAFGGLWIAEIGTRSGPAVGTIRPGALPRWNGAASTALPVTTLRVPERTPRIQGLGRGIEYDPSWGDLLSASVVFVVGQGIGGPDGVAEVRSLVTPIGAAVGATRRVVDLGWAPRQLQVGLTGLSLEPRLAVLLGVGGSTNHLVGLRRAGLLLAVNADPGALVFGRSDVGIVGDWRETLPALVAALSATPLAGRAR